jgi:hypothetical protein
MVVAGALTRTLRPEEFAYQKEKTSFNDFFFGKKWYQRLCWP